MDTRINGNVRASRLRALALALAFVLAAGFGSAAHLVGFAQQGQLPTPADLSRTFIEVAKQVKPAVVHIEVVEKARQAMRGVPEGFPQIPGFPQLGPMRPQPRRGSGSGVIISADGYILTNNHVAGEAAEIKVKLADGREMKARRIGSDPETDLAVIKIDAQGLPFARLGNSSVIQQGEWVIALGSPFGLQQTMTAGIVSATGRDLPGAGQFTNFIQTDASINPGNSGGPLVSMQGEIIGINTLIFTRSGGSEGIGFAIPADLVSKVYAQLVKTGRVSRGYLGVLLGEVTPAIASSVGYEGDGGVLVNDLADANSPAARAGLRSGDIVIEFDGKSVKSPKQLTELVADTPVGRAVSVKYVREGRVQNATINLAERPRPDDLARNEENTQDPDMGKIGIRVQTLTPELAREMNLRAEAGVIIQSVEPGSPADEAGLQAGDVIRRVGRVPITNAAGLLTALRSLKGSNEVVLQVESRGQGRGQLRFVTINLD
jgi:serine protease Do